jgi:hypothetical protein
MNKSKKKYKYVILARDAFLPMPRPDAILGEPNVLTRDVPMAGPDAIGEPCVLTRDV